MIIYPDLELRKGRLVNLVRNRIDSPLIYDVDPIQAARDLAAQGASKRPAQTADPHPDSHPDGHLPDDERGGRVCEP